MPSRIGQIIEILSRAKSRGAKLVGKSVLEKELKSIMDAPDVKLEENLPGIYGKNGMLLPNPQTFEDWCLTRGQNPLK